MFEKMIFQVKESKDHALAPVFLHPYVSWLKKRIQDKTVILVPSSAKKTKQRGFDSLKALYERLGCELLCPFEKDDVKQSQRSWTQRSRIKRHVHLVHPEMIQGKDIVLLDDVCTTGFTLKACLELVSPYVKSVEVVVLAVHPDNLKAHS
jgi:competence protein ComFC